MPIRNAYRLRWQPKGLSDSLDGNSSFPGAMALLSNLIPDPTTDLSWVCRPASLSVSTFAGFSSPGFVSGLLIVGDIAYGMIASARNAGHDEPFAFNLATRTFLTISGITSANTPVSPAISGDWAPPVLAQVGVRIVVTHPGFPGGATKIGWFDVSSLVSSTLTGDTHTNVNIDNISANALLAGWQPGMTITGTDIPANTTIVSIAANGLSIVLSQATTGAPAVGVALTVTGGTKALPQWAAGDLNVSGLPSVPVSVAQFNGRAYYACGLDGIVFSDSGRPTNRTNASQALTPNNGLPVTALGQLMLSATQTGGIVQSIIAFQASSAMQQIQGDPATTNLSMNLLPVATGTLAPLSITPTTFGLGFISPEGLRFILANGAVTDPVGDRGAGVSAPFIFSVIPSRICGAANADTIRFSVNNGVVPTAPRQEYWFDITRKIWSGPHSFPASLVQAWRSTFVIVADAINAKLWQSDPVASAASTYTENGVALTWIYRTTLLPDDDTMMMLAILEASIMLAPGGSNVTVSATDDGGVALDLVTISGSAVPASRWDEAFWDQARWDETGAFGAYRQRALNWNVTLVAKQLSIQFNAASDQAQRIGQMSLRYQRLGYQLGAA